MKILSLIALLFFLSACGGGGGGGSSTTPTPQPTPEAGVLDGVVNVSRPVQQKRMTVYGYSDGVRGESIGNTTTDSQGRYALTVNAPDGIVELVVEGPTGSYTEVATNTQAFFNARRLRALINYREGVNDTTAVTVFTHLAACYADYLIEQGGNANLSVDFANQEFSDIARVNILDTLPVDITEIDNTLISVNDVVTYSYLLAGISGVTATIAEENGQTQSNAAYTSIAFAELGCRDIRADGVLDGRGILIDDTLGDLFMGIVPIDANHYRSRLGQEALRIVESDANQLFFSPSDIFDYANRYALDTDSLYSGVDPFGADITGPVIDTEFNFDRKSAGTIEIPFTVTDNMSVSQVDFFIDGEFIWQAQTLDDIHLPINTSDYDDGFYELSVVATDTLANVSEEIYSLDFFNTSASLSIESSVLTSQQLYTISGTYQAVGVPIDRIEVNGEVAELNSATTWSLDVTLTDEINTLTAVIYDDIGNTASTDIIVEFDGRSPTAVSLNSTIRTSNNSGQPFNTCASSSFTTNVSNAICLLPERTSLSGDSPSPPSGTQSIWGPVILIDDWPGTDVFTDTEDLIVEYRYIRESDGVVVDWSTALRSSPSLNVAYVPMVIEYLDDDFYTHGIDEVHTIIFRVTDEAGNTSEIDFEFRINYLENQ